VLTGCLAFITYVRNVNLRTRTMVNQPNKHVGIFVNGTIDHYANTRDVVAQNTPAEFAARFRRSYGHTAERPVGLFYGTFPPGTGLVP
jgi:hypothetical protein